MKNTANLLKLVLFIIITLIASASFAEDTPAQIADSFYQHGTKMLQKGMYAEAINDFSRAFLLSPHDAKLHEALESLSRDKNVPAAQKMELILLEDLLDYTKKLKEKRDYFRYKRNVLGEELMDKGFDRAFFEKEMTALEQDFKVTHLREEKEIEERYSKGEDPLKVIHASLQLENKRLQKEIELYETQFNRLREVNAKHDYVKREIVYLTPAEFSRKRKFYDESGKRLPVEVKPVKMAREEFPAVDDISSLLDRARMRIDGMHSTLDDKNSKIEQLSKEVIDLSLELTEVKTSENKKANEVNQLKDELVEFESKNLLTQRLEKNFKSLKEKLAQAESEINDKEKKINDLNDKVQGLVKKSENLEKQLKGQDAEIDEYKKQVKALKAESQKIGDYQDEVNKLKQDLEKAKRYEDETWKLRHKLTKVKIQERDYRKLEKKLSKKEGQIEGRDKIIDEKDKTIDEKDKSLKELNRSILDLESRFELSQKIIKEKEKKIQTLEKKLAKRDGKIGKQLAKKEKEVEELNKILKDYRDKLSNTDKIISDKEKNINSLTEKLEATKVQLTKLEDNSFEVESLKKQNVQNTASLKQTIVDKERELKQITKMVNIYKNNLEAANKDLDYQKQQIDDLTKELVRIDQKVLTRDRLSREKINHIELLKDKLKQERQRRDQRNVKLREIIKSKVLEVQELEGMLEIYKTKLKDKHFLAEEREQMVNNLEAQLESTILVLNDKSQVIGKTHHNLVVLRSQLDEINDRLTEIKNTSVDANSNKTVNKEIQVLQTKIEDINTFIQGEIQSIETDDQHMSEVEPSDDGAMASDMQLNRI